MAAKKKQGLEGLKDTTGGKRRTDREAVDRTCFDPLSVDAKNVLTVVCLLQSPEELIQLRAVASLEVFGRKDPENLELLSSMDIFNDVYPIILKHPDHVARRFALKLIAMLSAYENFRKQMLKKENILETFMDILKRENDAVLQEFASLTLAELSNDYQVASELLKVKDCLGTLFLRLISADPDIEKNCLEIMIHLLNDINGIEVFIESTSFEMKTILNLITSSYPVIQALVIEVLTLLTSWCRDTRVLLDFRDAMGAELVLKLLETKDFADLHPKAFDLMINVTDCPLMCEYLHQSGCLFRFVRIMDNSNEAITVEKILGVLARMSQTKKGREALHSVEMEKRFTSYLEIQNENIQESSSLGIANLSQNINSISTIIEVNPVMSLLGIAADSDKSLKIRNVAAYSLNILCNADKKLAAILMENDDYRKLFSILLDNSKVSTELCQNVIQVFTGLCLYEEYRLDIITEEFMSAVMSCLPNGPCDTKDPSLEVDALECLSEYMIESDARYFFDKLDGTDLVLLCLRSKFASVREWAGHLVLIASQSKEFIKGFIQKDGLEWMLKEKNTMYSMPSWQSAIETIFSNFLPAKFAYTGRLDFQDITQEGFYVSSKPRTKFIILDAFIDMMLSPLVPIYVANFNIQKVFHEDGNSSKSSSVSSSQISVHNTTEPPNVNLQKYMKGADRNSLDYTWKGSLLTYPSVDYEESGIKQKEIIPPTPAYTPDPYLNDYLENLKKKISKEDSAFGDVSWFCLHPRIICNRARIIAEFVAEEMSGLEPNTGCEAHFKAAHINEIKYFLGTNILPLGLIRIGDYLERAVLFKVLADRIGFPCALVRGSYGRAWIEISVPVINVADSDENITESENERNPEPSKNSPTSTDSVRSESENSSMDAPCVDSVQEEGFWFPKISLEGYKGFPKNFLRANAIIDLIIQPGRILRINSYEAKEYCGEFLF